MFQAILDAIRWVGTAVDVSIRNALLWIWGTVWSWVQGLLDLVNLPDIVWPTAPPLFNYALASADLWFPVTESITLLGAYWTLYLATIPVRIILRHLPAVGG